MKKIIIFILLSLLSVTSSAEDKNTISGILQAYWLPDVDESLTNKPSLELRFFTFNEKGSFDKVIDINKKNLSGDFIKTTFAVVPDEFLRYKEGHVEQSGLLRLSHFKSFTECDSVIYTADYVDFKPQDGGPELSKLSGFCGPYPYQLFYMLKPALEKTTLSDKPDNGGKAIAVVTHEELLVKIKTISPQWYYVAVVDDSKADDTGDVKGYIRASDVDLSN